MKKHEPWERKKITKPWEVAFEKWYWGLPKETVFMDREVLAQGYRRAYFQGRRSLKN